MPRAARRRHQIDASQSGLRLLFDRRLICQSSALAVRAHCENRLGAVRIRTLHPLPAEGDPNSEFSFHMPTCYVGPGFCRFKPSSVVLYRAFELSFTLTSCYFGPGFCRLKRRSVVLYRAHVQSFCTAQSVSSDPARGEPSSRGPAKLNCCRSKRRRDRRQRRSLHHLGGNSKTSKHRKAAREFRAKIHTDHCRTKKWSP